MVQEDAKGSQGEACLDKFIKQPNRTTYRYSMSLEQKIDDLEKEIQALVDKIESIEEKLEEIHERLDEIEEKLEDQ